ncbi:SDR family oxidoreductase [Sphingomonas oryzagri]|jgi:NAD(P)-dependent dehydrogenase (short-subunit alcohol dehydrogenase family)|uniref:SDR family NAD(P)-dependent oxidoreductase n=1 Tax=Sphingomonas oryzagri TaxID=3042314 RepID=A0ABT6N1L1_9SPHN|nr:SDR family NAD(P)-dependent oxidoreductase [Sphingomonas oryzagri]MDH7639164.1 SDR family NAD(P)-dependent oxidoreductase [Sphingomonas oryzagri]
MEASARPDFTGCRALVTGAGRGIGRAIARELAYCGAAVLCVARTQSELDETVSGAGDRAIAVSCDIGDAGAGDRLMHEVAHHLGGLDILVHCAGIFVSGSLEQTPLSELDRLYAVNVRAPFALTKAALPVLIREQGQIVFIGSSIVRAANLAGRGGYAAMQAAFKALADATRDEVNDRDVRVLMVTPGTTATPRQARIFAQAEREYRPERLLQPEDVAQMVCAALSLPRTAEVTDIQVRPMLKS